MTARRVTVDLTAYSDLIVVYLGMRVNVLTGIKTLLGFGPKIASSVTAQPEGLLLHENIVYSRRMSECANTGVTLNRLSLNTGRAQNRIGFGGLSF